MMVVMYRIGSQFILNPQVKKNISKRMNQFSKLGIVERVSNEEEVLMLNFKLRWKVV